MRIPLILLTLGLGFAVAAPVRATAPDSAGIATAPGPASHAPDRDALAFHVTPFGIGGLQGRRLPGTGPGSGLSLGKTLREEPDGFGKGNFGKGDFGKRRHRHDRSDRHGHRDWHDRHDRRRRPFFLIPRIDDDDDDERTVIVPVPTPAPAPPEAAAEPPEPAPPPDPRGPAIHRARGAGGDAPFAVGEPLPRDVPHVALDWRLYDLPEPPPGLAYARVARTVLLIDPATRVVERVVDAAELAPQEG